MRCERGESETKGIIPTTFSWYPRRRGKMVAALDDDATAEGAKEAARVVRVRIDCMLMLIVGLKAGRRSVAAGLGPVPERPQARRP
jgi:hypothetical protein